MSGTIGPGFANRATYQYTVSLTCSFRNCLAMKDLQTFLRNVPSLDLIIGFPIFWQ